MAYNSDKDITAGYISPLHQDLLEQLKTSHKRTKRGELEQIIEQAFINDNGYEHYRALKDVYEADTQVTTAASERPNTTAEAEKNAPAAQLEGSDGK